MTQSVCALMIAGFLSCNTSPQSRKVPDTCLFCCFFPLLRLRIRLRLRIWLRISLRLKIWLRPQDLTQTVRNDTSSCLLFQIPFTKDCGADEVCTSDLVLSVSSETQTSRWTPQMFPPRYGDVFMELISPVDRSLLACLPSHWLWWDSTYRPPFVMQKVHS